MRRWPRGGGWQVQELADPDEILRLGEAEVHRFVRERAPVDPLLRVHGEEAQVLGAEEQKLVERVLERDAAELPTGDRVEVELLQGGAQPAGLREQKEQGAISGGVDPALAPAAHWADQEAEVHTGPFEPVDFRERFVRPQSKSVTLGVKQEACISASEVLPPEVHLLTELRKVKRAVCVEKNRVVFEKAGRDELRGRGGVTGDLPEGVFL